MKKALVVLLALTCLVSVGALADIQSRYDPDDAGDILSFGDENELWFGGVADFHWETGDANANCLVLDLPTGGAVDVPVFAIVSAESDMGYFNAWTDNNWAVENAAGTGYIAGGFSGTTLAQLLTGGATTQLSITSPILINTGSTSITDYTPSRVIGYDSGASLTIAVADTTGDTTITHAGSNKAVAWTSTGGFTFTGAFSVVGALSASSITGYAIGTNVQAYDADLTTYAGITPSANVQTLLGAADFAAVRTSLGLVIGTNVQAYDADLTTFAGITPSANVQTLLGAADFAAVTTSLGLTIGTNTQAYDADLTTYAGITPSANVQTLLGAADFAAVRTSLGLVIGTNVQAYDADLTTYAGITPSATAQVALEHGNSAALMSHRHRVTVEEINAGHELLPAISGHTYRIVDFVAIAYGGAVGTTTTVDILGTQSAGSVKLATFAQANLTQSTPLTIGSTGVTILADAATFVPCDANSAITVGKTGDNADTATGVDFIITYVIE